MEKEVNPANQIPIKPLSKIQTTPKKISVPPKPKIPSSNPNLPVQKNKKIKYEYVGKEKLSDLIKKTIPKQLIPTKNIGKIFSYIFIAVLVIAALTFPYSSFISGNEDMSLKIGIPLSFLILDATQPSKIPIKFGGLAIDIIIYIILAYAIDIIINLITKNPIFKSKEELKKYPKFFEKTASPTIADKLAKKIIQKTSSKKTPTPKNKTISIYNLNKTKTTSSSKRPSQLPTSSPTSPSLANASSQNSSDISTNKNTSRPPTSAQH